MKFKHHYKGKTLYSAVSISNCFKNNRFSTHRKHVKIDPSEKANQCILGKNKSSYIYHF